MNKIDELQNVLKVYLTDADMSYIRTYWSAFFENPKEFEDDKVCDMILDDLKKVPIKDWNKLKGGNKNMDLDVVLLGIPGLVVNHYTPDDTIAWGQYEGSKVIIKKISDIPVPDFMDKTTGTVNKYISQHAGPVYVIVRNIDDATILAFGFEPDWIVSEIQYTNLVPSGYEYIGMFSFDVPTKTYLQAMLETAVDLYVPCAKGPRDSIIPILWNVSRTAVGACQLDTCKIADMLNDLRITDEYVHELMGFIEKQFPAVDLDTEQRYSWISVIGEVNEYTFFGYNRNHVAYNGTVEDYKAIMPIILTGITGAGQKLVDTNILDYICGKISASQIVIWYAGDNMKPLNPLGFTDNIKLSTDVPKYEEFYRKGSANPLIRAAEKADVKIK